MSPRTVALLAALEALIVAAIGLAVCLVPLTVLWAAQYHLAGDFTIVWRAAADIWLVGHGVNLTVGLDPQTVAELGLPAAGVPFQVTIALLGFAVLTAALGARTGLRAAETGFRLTGAISAVVAFALVALVVTLSAGAPVVQPSLWQGVVLPPFVYALGVGIGLIGASLRTAGAPESGGAKAGSSAAPGGSPPRGEAGETRRAGTVLAPVRLRAGRLSSLRSLPEPLRVGGAAALRAGTAATAIVIGCAALALTLLIFGNYGSIISLYEQLQTGVVGGIALTVAQLALLPNLVVWIAAWFVGPGFALGTGSSVSPIGTALGPVPGVPLFAVVPAHGYSFGLVGVVVPLLAGFAAATLLRLHRGPLDAFGLPSLLLSAVGIGVVAGVELGLLAWWSSGALGPGRLHDVGPNPWLVAGLTAAEVGVAAVIGLVVGARVRR